MCASYIGESVCVGKTERTPSNLLGNALPLSCGGRLWKLKTWEQKIILFISHTCELSEGFIAATYYFHNKKKSFK